MNSVLSIKVLVLLMTCFPMFNYTYGQLDQERSLNLYNTPKAFYQDPRLYNESSETTGQQPMQDPVYSFPTLEGLEEDNFAD